MSSPETNHHGIDITTDITKTEINNTKVVPSLEDGSSVEFEEKSHENDEITSTTESTLSGNDGKSDTGMTILQNIKQEIQIVNDDVISESEPDEKPLPKVDGRKTRFLRPKSRTTSAVNTKYRRRKDVYAKAYQLIKQFGGQIVIIYADNNQNSTVYTNTDDMWNRLVEKGLKLADVLRGRARRVEMLCGAAGDVIKERTVDTYSARARKNKKNKKFHWSNPESEGNVSDMPMALYPFENFQEAAINTSVSQIPIQQNDINILQNAFTTGNFVDNLVDQAIFHETEKQDFHMEVGSQVEKGNNNASISDMIHEETPEQTTAHKNKCTSCDKSFRTLGNLKRHERVHHKQSLRCPVCNDDTFKSIKQYQEHVKMHSLEEGLTCHACNVHFENRSEMEMHLKNCVLHSMVSSFAVEQSTSDETPNIPQPEPKKQKKAGKQESEDATDHQCSSCGKIFKNEKLLRYHFRRIHTVQKKVLCDICGDAFNNKNYLRKHRQTVHDTETASCTTCGKILKNRRSLQTHMKLHTEPKSHLCTICGKAFRSKCDVRTHEQSHTTDDPIPCPTCNKLFKNKTSLKKHVQLHSDKTYPCNVCEKVCHSRDALYSHKIHKHDEYSKKYHCDICGKQFLDPYRLKIHGVVHTGDKPYKCPICGGGYTQAYYVKRHMQSQHGKPIKSDQ